MDRQQFQAIDAVARSVIGRYRSIPAEVRYDMRQELRQDLALKVAEGDLPLEFLRRAALDWVSKAVRDFATQRETELSYEQGPQKRYKVGDVWEPSWYPPRHDAKEFAPLACKGARLMHCKASRCYSDVASAIVEYLSS